jgi:hypothetical protein
MVETVALQRRMCVGRVPSVAALERVVPKSTSDIPFGGAFR